MHDLDDLEKRLLGLEAEPGMSVLNVIYLENIRHSLEITRELEYALAAALKLERMIEEDNR